MPTVPCNNPCGLILNYVASLPGLTPRGSTEQQLVLAGANRALNGDRLTSGGSDSSGVGYSVTLVQKDIWNAARASNSALVTSLINNLVVV